jgi:hypothetical protein
MSSQSTRVTLLYDLECIPERVQCDSEEVGTEGGARESGVAVVHALAPECCRHEGGPGCMASRGEEPANQQDELG